MRIGSKTLSIMTATAAVVLILAAPAGAATGEIVMRQGTKTLSDCTAKASVVAYELGSSVEVFARARVVCASRHNIKVQSMLKVGGSASVWSQSGTYSYTNAFGTYPHDSGRFQLWSCTYFQAITNFTVDGTASYTTSGSPKMICATYDPWLGGWKLITSPG